MLQAIGNLKISPATKPLSQVYKEVKESGENQPGTLFLISDFQKKNCDSNTSSPTQPWNPSF